MSCSQAAATLVVPRSRIHQPPTMAFVDASYLQRAACRALGLAPNRQRLDVEHVRDWLRDGPLPDTDPAACERVCWYDGAFAPGHPRAEAHARYLHAIGQLDLVQPRLGYVSEVTPDWQEDVRRGLESCDADLARFEERCPLGPSLRQKGVDITLAIDLVRLADRGALGHALLVIGDSDFAPAIEVARDEGVLITILTPERFTIAAKLRQVADRTVEIPTSVLGNLLRRRPERVRPLRAVAAAPDNGSAGAEADGPRASGQAPTRAARPALRAVPPPPEPERAVPPPAGGEPPRAAAPTRAEATVASSPPLAPFAEADRVGFSVPGPAGAGRIYMVPASAGPIGVEVYYGAGDPSADIKLGTHRPPLAA